MSISNIKNLKVCVTMLQWLKMTTFRGVKLYKGMSVLLFPLRRNLKKKCLC